MRFTDRYSVFDYGVLADEIPGKGTASCAMAVRSFALFEKAGLRTHFLEQVADDAIRVQLLDVDTDGGKGPTGPGRTVPLQVIYRLALPRESSVHRRAAAGLPRRWAQLRLRNPRCYLPCRPRRTSRRRQRRMRRVPRTIPSEHLHDLQTASVPLPPT